MPERKPGAAASPLPFGGRRRILPSLASLPSSWLRSPPAFCSRTAQAAARLFVSALLSFVLVSAVWARVASCGRCWPGPAAAATGPKLSFSRMAFLELGTRRSLDDVVLVNTVSLVNVSVCKETEARVVTREPQVRVPTPSGPLSATEGESAQRGGLAAGNSRPFRA